MHFSMRTIPLCAVLVASVATAFASPRAQSTRAAAHNASDVVYEATITDLQAAMTAGRLTAVDLVNAYLARIAAYDQQGPTLNALIRLNPNARAEAVARDAERRAGRVRGPLHGIPIILKDNFDTADLPTTAGSVALAGYVPPSDGFQVHKLREAGAVILGKANMHELASGITTISSLGGQTCNPYDPSRNPGGSSGGSGAAVAASFAAIAWGTDTCGSIRIPAAHHNLFGLRPTKGLSSITGIIPLAHTQDVAGPLARTVMDLAIGLDATIGPDPADPATRILDRQALPSFVASLNTTALRGARLGVLTSYFGDQPEDQEAARIVRAAIDRMKARGAEVVEVSIPGLDSVVMRASVIDLEFKFDLADYLARSPAPPVTSLTSILDHGLYHAALEAALKRRDTVRARDSEAYRAALARRTVVRDMVVKVLDEQRLDALVYPTVRRKPATIGEPQRGATCQLSAVTGLPALTAPAGFTPDGLPIGVELLGRALSDTRLVAFAYDYEQATRPRRPPPTTPPLVDGQAPSPVTFAVATNGGGARVAASFTLDALQQTLHHDVRIEGATARRVEAVTLERASGDRPGAVLYRLSGAGRVRSNGTLHLLPDERRDLLDGRLVLGLYTSGASTAPLRAPLIVPRSAAESRFRFEPVQPELLGQGGSFANAWADYDGDGDLDLFVGFGGATPNRLYRNDRGKLTEVGAAAGVADARATRSAAWGDFDADGDPDLLVGFAVGAGPVLQLYRNDSGHFIAVTREVGLVRDSGSVRQLSWVDVDADGDLDLFVAFRDKPNAMYRNQDGRFTDVAAEIGLADARKSVGAVWFDFDEDGDLDLYVANQDGDANGLWRNDGGRFVDVAPASGVAWGGRTPNDPQNGTVRPCAADVDNDGHLDLFAANYGKNGLLLNRGGGRFEDVSAAWGVAIDARYDACAFSDADLDGRLDLYVNGTVTGGVSYRDHLFRNTGMSFEDVTPDNVLALQADHGVQWADFDNDGDEDLALTGARPDGMHLLLRNLLPTARGRSLQVRVVDGRGRATRAGAEVRLYSSGTRRVLGTRLVDTGSGYNAQNDMPVHFGLASASTVDVEVVWPAGGKRVTVMRRGVRPAEWAGKVLVIQVQ